MARYPRGLDAAAMIPEARMMAIADIFEVLTASDRPYKLGKPLSEAVALLAGYVRMGHLDRELFEFFCEKASICVLPNAFSMRARLTKSISNPR